MYVYITQFLESTISQQKLRPDLAADGFMYIASGPRKNPVVRAVCVQPYNPQTGKGVMCVSWWSKNYKSLVRQVSGHWAHQ